MPVAVLGLAASAMFPLPAVAASPNPVPIAPWHTIGDSDQSIDAAGRGIVVFPHGEHVWTASVTPTGKLMGVGQVSSPPTAPDDMVAAQDDAGDVLAGNVAFTDDTVTSGIGSARQPWTTRFAWGEPSPASRFLAQSDGDAESLRAAMRGDGTVVLAWSQQDPNIDGPNVPYVAFLPKVGASVVTKVTGLVGGVPEAVGATASGAFFVGWFVGSRVRLTRVGADGTVGAAERVPGSYGTLRPRLLFDPLGDVAIAWQDTTKGRAPSVRVATRPAGSSTFRTQVLATGRDRYADAAIGADGTVAVLVRHPGKKLKGPNPDGFQPPAALRVLRRRPDGSVASPVTLPGKTYGDVEEAYLVAKVPRMISVDGHGRAVVAYPMLTSRSSVARVVRVARSGAVHGLATKPGCSPLDLVSAPSGASLLTLQCARPAARRPSERQGGAVLAFPAP